MTPTELIEKLRAAPATVEFDEVIVGPRQRQIRTEAIARSVYDAQGAAWPQAEVHPEFDEHVVDQLLGEPRHSQSSALVPKRSLGTSEVR